MILLIILGSGAGAPAAADPGPASPAPPGVAELAGQLHFPLGMIYVSIPRVKYVPSIYRYLSDTVPEVSRLWYTTICDTCSLYLSVHIISWYSFMSVSVFIRILLYCTYLQCLYFSTCTAYVLSGHSILWYPILFGAAHSQFPEAVFVSIKCFAGGGGGCVQRIKIFMPNPTICTNVMGGGVWTRFYYDLSPVP